MTDQQKEAVKETRTLEAEYESKLADLIDALMMHMSQVMDETLLSQTIDPQIKSAIVKLDDRLSDFEIMLGESGSMWLRFMEV